jgi:TatA/E family protein of Tat protein translocase
VREVCALAWVEVGIESPVHLLFLGVVALLVLGPKRLPELARALGKGMREFREAISVNAHDDEK